VTGFSPGIAQPVGSNERSSVFWLHEGSRRKLGKNIPRPLTADGVVTIKLDVTMLCIVQDPAPVLPSLPSSLATP
jgi:hypothetical protein